MVRLIVFVIFVLLLSAPLYHLLKKYINRVNTELEEDDTDEETQLEELSQKKKKLQRDCKEKKKLIEKRINKINKVQTKL